jgi:hypothetical protein
MRGDRRILLLVIGAEQEHGIIGLCVDRCDFEFGFVYLRSWFFEGMECVLPCSRVRGCRI